MAYRHEERARLAREMPAKAITVAQDETFTGGLCLIGLEAGSNSMLLEQAAQARAQDTWHTLMEQALVGLNCQGIPSTSDAAPGLLASVEHHLGAHHAPDLFHVQHALSKAVSGPMATKQRAAAKAAETRKQAHESLDMAHDVRAQRGPGRPPKGVASLEQVTQAVEAARHEPQRLSAQREQVTQSIRAIGHAYHFVDLERGVRRHGQRIAGDIHERIGTMRTMAQQENLSQVCLERLEKAERVVPKMQATIELVSG